MAGSFLTRGLGRRLAGFVGYNRVSKEHGGVDDSNVQGGSLAERAATIMRMSGEEMNADSKYKDIVQAPLDRGYDWASGQLRCGYDLREEEPPAKWAGSKCETTIAFRHDCTA